MRLLLFLPALLLVAACDSTPADGHALIGEWTTVETRSESLVESRIDQQVPDFGAEGTGDLAATGGARLPLAAVTGVGPSDATVRASEEGGAVLRLRESDIFASEARLTLDDSLYTARLAVGADLFTFADGRLTVPEITLVGQDGARRQFRVGGARAVPMRTLRAGEEVVSGTSATPLRPDLGAYAIRFRDDGTARRREIASNARPVTPTFGRWEASGADALTLTFDEEPVSYRYRFEDGALLLEQPGRTLTEGENLRNYEAQLFAEPGSLVRLRYRSAVVFRSQEVVVEGIN